MAGPKLDGAGIAKMTTLEDAFIQMQRVHALVEQMASMVKAQRGAGVLGMQVKRAASPLVGQLKGQFGMISDQVAALILVSTRGGSEQMKVRALREGVAQIRTQLELAVAKTKELHAAKDEDDHGKAPESNV